MSPTAPAAGPALDPCAGGHVGPFGKKPTGWVQFEACLLHQCDPHIRADIDLLPGPGRGKCWKCKVRLACSSCFSTDLKDGGRKCRDCGRRSDG